MSPELAYRILSDSTAPIAGAINESAGSQLNTAKAKWLNALNQQNRIELEQRDAANRAALFQQQSAAQSALQRQQSAAQSALQRQQDDAAMGRAVKVQGMIDERSAQQRIRDALKIFNEAGAAVPPRNQGESLLDWADRLEVDASKAAVKYKQDQIKDGAKRINTIEQQIADLTSQFGELGVDVTPSAAATNLALAEGMGKFQDTLVSVFEPDVIKKFSELARTREIGPDKAAKMVSRLDSRFEEYWNEYKSKAAILAAADTVASNPNVGRSPEMQRLRIELSNLLEMRNKIYASTPAEAFNLAFDERVKGRLPKAAAGTGDVAQFAPIYREDDRWRGGKMQTITRDGELLGENDLSGFLQGADMYQRNAAGRAMHDAVGEILGFSDIPVAGDYPWETRTLGFRNMARDLLARPLGIAPISRADVAAGFLRNPDPNIRQQAVAAVSRFTPEQKNFVVRRAMSAAANTLMGPSPRPLQKMPAVPMPPSLSEEEYIGRYGAPIAPQEQANAVLSAMPAVDTMPNPIGVANPFVMYPVPAMTNAPAVTNAPALIAPISQSSTTNSSAITNAPAVVPKSGPSIIDYANQIRAKVSSGQMSETDAANALGQLENAVKVSFINKRMNESAAISNLLSLGYSKGEAYSFLMGEDE
jgi:hypothetical protein